MPSSRDSFRRNRVAPVVAPILPLLASQCSPLIFPPQPDSVAVANAYLQLIDNPNGPSENQTRGLFFSFGENAKMTPDSSSMDQAVSRAIRANLESLQRQSEELHQAVADLISACASSRPANALSATLRAQSTAAALGASLEVLGRFIASAGQSSRNAGDDFAPRGMETLRAVSTPAREPEPSHPEPPVPIPMSTASEPSSEVADTSSSN